jgi:hypothetical protein
MKRIGLIFVLLLTTALSGFAQCFNISANVGWYGPGLSNVSGFVDTARVNISSRYFQEMAVGYRGQRGWICAVSVGNQVESYSFSEVVKSWPNTGLNFNKSYKSFPVCFSSGYIMQISELPKYFLFANASIGFANVRSNDKDVSISKSSTYYWTAMGGYDTMYYHEEVIDDSRAQNLMQARLSLGGEFRTDHFFIRAYSEYRTWADYFGALSYHSTYSSTLMNQNRDRSGSYRLRTAYIGLVFSAGFYFPREEKS